VAILEYLEEAFEDRKSLLPKDPVQRAKVREITEMINSGIQPIQNLAVMKKVSQDQGERVEWNRYWIDLGLKAVEKHLATSSGEYSVGNDVTLADCCLIPQLANAKRYFYGEKVA